MPPHGGCSSHKHFDADAKEADQDHGATLYPMVDIDKVKGLNESKTGAAKKVIKPWDKRKDDTKVVRSVEGDGELIIHIPFTVQVKFKSFTIIGGDAGSAPKEVKIWKNRDDIDFETAEDVKCDQKFNLAYDKDGTVQYLVKMHKFQNTSSLTMLFTGNFEEKTTQINWIGLKGVGTKNKHGIVQAVYEARPVESDHKKLADHHVSKGIK
eukprot:CAMPEP_0167747222 /NCGR_PEP_ID=MMETSP0110_2-20121227/4161_1 /TAXON_ID=629695 /ORGANISM="Gymnochlora sp., Strain CCMP2014" /LENGTH=209 /DNA_ID=CAMNT_0007632099 /DNA_START=47 /DNA_END=676 /DNA_ORIENTATION=+